MMTQNPTGGLQARSATLTVLIISAGQTTTNMTDIDARFKKAVWLIRNGPKQDSSNETKLLYYRCLDIPPPPEPPAPRDMKRLPSKGNLMLCSAIRI